jgi:uncharacterized protein YhbP (UPF0306 family)
MPKLQDLIITYLDETRMMQVATCANNQPWCCTVYFSVDNLHNLYWISKPDRRHSEELRRNPKVAGVIVQPHTPGDKVRGLQFQGLAHQISDPGEIRTLAESYVERFAQHALAEDMISGANPQCLYQIKPETFVLFDELNFPEASRQEWQVS